MAAGCGGSTGQGTGSGGTGGVVGSGGAVGTGSGGTDAATGGATSSGGSTASGGATSSGGATASGGATGSGGNASGGTGPGGASGGQAGAPAMGGRAGGGSAGRGGANGGGGATSSGGAGGTNAFRPSFWLGADITDQVPAPAAAQDSLLKQMKAHGFNSVRLRTFVDPKAADGYDKTNGYADTAHTTTFGKKVKDAGMGLLVDFHYSDNWADPGKQCVPIAWQSLTTIADLAKAVHDYTKDAITKMIAGGARPDMVQIGNETTPGMLLHKCDSGGLPTGNNTITGSTSNWGNLGMLLKAGVAGVKEVDPTIIISLHIDRGNSFSATKSWIDNAVKQGVTFDAFGESCYQKYQGDPDSVPNTVTGWTTTFAQLVAAYPNILFFAAEYGPMQREINDVIYNLPKNQGLGTFNWEPTTEGDWNRGHALLRRSGNTYTELPDLALYDAMKTAYASRL